MMLGEVEKGREEVGERTVHLSVLSFVLLNSNLVCSFGQFHFGDDYDDDVMSQV